MREIHPALERQPGLSSVPISHRPENALGEVDADVVRSVGVKPEHGLTDTEPVGQPKHHGETQSPKLTRISGQKEDRNWLVASVHPFVPVRPFLVSGLALLHAVLLARTTVRELEVFEYTRGHWNGGQVRVVDEYEIMVLGTFFSPLSRRIRTVRRRLPGKYQSTLNRRARDSATRQTGNTILAEQVPLPESVTTNESRMNLGPQLRLGEALVLAHG